MGITSSSIVVGEWRNETSSLGVWQWIEPILDGELESKHKLLIVKLSLGNSVGGILDPKKENMRKSNSIKELVFSAPPTKKVTKLDLDPKSVPTVSDPKRLIRKSKNL